MVNCQQISYRMAILKMSQDNHVVEYQKQIERKMERIQNNFNSKMIRTTLNQVTRDKTTVFNFITCERDEQKKKKLWNLLTHLSIFVDMYDGCGADERKKPSFYRNSQTVWKMMREQTEGGRKIFLISTTSPCYGFDNHFYSYQVTIKGVNGNHLELLDPYLESLQARCLLGDVTNPEPIVPFSPLSTARLQSILDVSEDPEPVTRDESVIGREEDLPPTASIALLDIAMDQPTPAERDFDEESTGWFDLEAEKIIRRANAAARAGKPIESRKIGLLPIILGIIIFLMLTYAQE